MVPVNYTEYSAYKKHVSLIDHWRQLSTVQNHKRRVNSPKRCVHTMILEEIIHISMMVLLYVSQ